MNFRSRYTKDYEGYTKRQVEIDTSASLTSNDQKSKTNVHSKYIERERELFFFFVYSSSISNLCNVLHACIPDPPGE